MNRGQEANTKQPSFSIETPYTSSRTPASLEDTPYIPKFPRKLTSLLEVVLALASYVERVSGFQAGKKTCHDIAQVRSRAGERRDVRWESLLSWRLAVRSRLPPHVTFNFNPGE